MRLREPRWARFIDAAVGEVQPAPTVRRREVLKRQVVDLKRRLSEAHAAQADAQEHRRPDARLLPCVVAVWGTAALAVTLPWQGGALVALLLVPAMLGLLGLLLMRSGRRRRRPPTHGPPSHGPLSLGPAAGHFVSRRAPAGGALILAALCAVGVLAVVGMRMQMSVMSAMGQAMMNGSEVLVAMEVSETPRPLQSGNGTAQVMFNAVITQGTAAGKITHGRLTVRVMAGPAWTHVRAGQLVGAAGKLQSGTGTDSKLPLMRLATPPLPPPDGPPLPQVGPLSPPGGPSAAPATSAAHPDSNTAVAQGGSSLVVSIREAWTTTTQRTWEQHSPDAAALLPGMVMGDRGSMDESLKESMKVVGLTHLTAVSGANCTLVLASLMLVVRSLRTPRILASAIALGGLVGFVTLVGPDPSVLRAAVMGSIGAMALLSGRPKRVGALLSASIVVLLLADPWLALDYAFILSVLATLGLHLVGQRCVRWLSVLFPLWLAQAIAIPLAAQLFCAPVIVLLQARLTPYTIVANMAAAPVVALVTTAGTLGLVCALPLPGVAVACAALSGAGAWWVAGVARWMSALPAASLPWPEGVVGVVLMAVANVAVVLALVAVVERRRTDAVVTLLMDFVPGWWRQRFGFASVVILAAGLAFGWSAAVVL